jgi:hypothetical protein
MTVLELITVLQKHPPDASVTFHDEEICITAPADIDGESCQIVLDQINESGGL